MKTTKTLLLLMLLYAAGMVNAQCVWYYPSYQGGGAYTFTASIDSSATSATYNWTFDDGGTATGHNVQHTFTTTGLHSWCLNYQGNCSVTLCDTQYVNICDIPIYVNHTEGDTVVTFTAHNVPGGSTYSWSFPDGVPATSTSASPTIVFPGPGNHWGNLDITTPNGCTVNANASVNISVEQHTGNCNPWVNAYTGNFGQVNFQAYSDSTPFTTYQWDFGDGTGSTQQMPQHTYTASGTYTYCVNYSSPNCSGSICRTIDIDVCNASTYITNTQADSTFTFTLNGVPGGSTYAWSFPDGNITTSTSASPVVTFPGDGSYDVSVTAVTPGGCTLTQSQTVTITYGTCDGNLVDLLVYGDSAMFYVIPDSVPGISNQFIWNFGDGTTYTAGQFGSHRYAASGTYNVCVTINGSMCTNTICDTVVIDVCQFNTDAYIANSNGTSVTFAVTYVQPGSTYQWAFSSGTPSTSTDANPVVNFPAYGSYNASVTVTTGTGCVKNDVFNFSVSNNPCNVTAQAYDNNAGMYYFGAYPSPYVPGLTYAWDFGDGTTGTGNGGYHTFAASGTYNYCVSYTSSGACNGTVCGTVTVDICHFYQGMRIDQQDSVYTFDLYADTMDLWTYQWSFPGGNPSTSTAIHPSVTYSAPGSYPVYANYIAHNGCTGTIVDTVHVANQGFNQCNAYFTHSIVQATFEGYPQDSLSSQSTYSWDFGDGNTYTGMFPIHTYATTGTYQVCLTVTGPNCTDTYCRNAYVNSTANYCSIMGAALKGGQGICDGYVYLITDSGGFLTAIDTFDFTQDTSSCYSHYYFTGLPSGTYYLKAALAPTDADYANYMPTYSLQELTWANADAITVNAGGSWSASADINMIAGTNPGGPGFVSGWVTQGAGLGIEGGVDESRAEGDPLAGIQVNLLNSAGAAVGYTYSDGTGAFSFDNLALGTYRIYAEALGKTPIELTFTLTQNNPSINNIAIEVNSNSTVGIAGQESLYVDGLMPNPTNNKATLAVTVKQSAEANLSVRNLTGQLIQDKKLQLATGANNITVDLSSQPTGVYYITLTGKNGTRVLKLVKTQ